MNHLLRILPPLILLSCSSSRVDDHTRRENDHTGSGSFDGRVKTSSHPNVKEGSLCNGSFVMRGTTTPTTMTIKCDGVTVYKGEGVFTNNTNDAANTNDDTMTYTDKETSDKDKTPAVSLVAQEGKADGDSGVLSIDDVQMGNIPAFEIIISL